MTNLKIFVRKEKLKFMNKIIISINPEHVKNILSGKKIYEFRRTAAKKDISSILIYETIPTKMIVAEADIEEVIKADPETLWQITKNYAGITKDFFDSYFKGKTIAYAYKLKNVRSFERPKSLNEFGFRYPPQSFVYYRG